MNDMDLVRAYIKALTLTELKGIVKGAGIRLPEDKEEKKEESK